MNRNELSIERQAVLMGSVEINEADGERFKEIINNCVNWAEIIFQLITHRTLNMFYYNLKKFSLLESMEKELQKLFKTQSQAYYERNKYYLEVLGEVLNEFEKNDVVVPILKGNLLASKVYPSIEARAFNDLDLLMKLDDVSKVTKSLEDIGFKQGHFDEEKGIIVEATRREKVLQQVSSHELQEFQKLSDNSFAKLVQVDVNHDILWKGKCPYKVDTKDLIERAIPIEINNSRGYMLDYIDNIIQLSCHLYKEAVLMMWITDLRDLKIYKFADLFMYIKKFYNEIDWSRLTSRVKGYNLDKVIYYNFHFIELMFGEIIPQNVMSELRPDDLTYLDEYGVENEEPAIWEYDFFTRLFDTNRVLTLKEEQYSKLSRFFTAKEKSGGTFTHRAN